MGNFVTVPYLGTSRPSNSEIRANGVFTHMNNTTREYMAAYGTNSNVSLPVIVAAKYGSSGRALFALNSGFSIATTTVTGGTAISNQYGISGVYYYTNPDDWHFPDGTYEPFASFDEAAQGFINSLRPEGYRNISYSFQNGIIVAPTFAPIGSQVTAYLTGNPGASVSSESITIMRDGSPIEFEYSNGVLKFTVQ